MNSTPARRIGAIVTALALGTSFMAVAPLSASADTVKTGAYAEGRFLSGSIAGIDLDKIAKLKSAEARNDGTQGTREEEDPLTATVLDSIKVDVPGGLQLGLGEFIDAGALSQYAQAKRDGNAVGASGAVSNNGAIGAGSKTTKGGSLTLDLDKLLAKRYSGVVTDLKLQLEAVAGQAKSNKDSASGDYNLDGAKLLFTSPALSDLAQKVADSLDPISGSLASVSGPNGGLANAINRILVNLNPVLNLVGGNASVSATVTADIKTPVQPIVTGTYSSPGVTMDLSTGLVTVDLEKLHGGSLNDLPAGTELLSDNIINAVLNSITGQIASIADQVKNKVEIALGNAQVDVDVSVKGLSRSAGTPAVPGTPGLPAVVCNVLDILHLCTPSAGTPGTPGIPAILGQTLESSADVHVHGTVDQVIAGTAAADAKVKLLGGTVNASVGTDAVLSGMGGALQSGLLGSDSAISHLVTRLNSTVVNPTVSALIGPADGTVSDVLKGLVSAKVNIKETTMASPKGMAIAPGTLFTETALRVTVLPELGAASLATLNLGAATVGSQVAVIIDPNDPGNPGNPPTTGNPGDPGTPGNPSTISAVGNLAYTGVGIATIIALILALLVVGAYLAREGYRRRQLKA